MQVCNDFEEEQVDEEEVEEEEDDSCEDETEDLLENKVRAK